MARRQGKRPTHKDLLRSKGPACLGPENGIFFPGKEILMRPFLACPSSFVLTRFLNPPIQFLSSAFTVFLFSTLLISQPTHGQLTSGADFLKLAGSARGVGMGDAFVAVSDDVTALTWNPAGLALLQHPEIGYLRMQYLVDTAYNFAGAVFPITTESGTFGIGGGFINLGV